ncbi:UNVERIFIED_CONTAM: hypothetical protein FKN15_009166 [Acipenser sinensis]
MRKCFLFYIKDNFIPIENNNNSAVIIIGWTSGTAAVCSLQPSGWLSVCLSDRTALDRLTAASALPQLAVSS